MTVTIKLLRLSAACSVLLTTATAFDAYYEPERLINFHEPVVGIYLMGVVLGIALCKR